MASLLSTTPTQRACYLATLDEGSWALVPPNDADGPPWYLFLCLHQDRTGKTHCVNFNGPYPGIHRTDFRDKHALLLPSMMDATYRFDSVIEGNGGPAAMDQPILAMDSDGPFLLAYDHDNNQLRKVDLATGLVSEEPPRYFWTKDFTLRCRSNPDEPWSEVLRMGTDTGQACRSS